ncbi:MAG: MoaD/ThiS family protein [Spirochaetales bacterium]|nr:MoaD/ThiS family protein [Spirochaetales bacterium]
MDQRITVKLFAGLNRNFAVPDSIDLTSAHKIGEIITAIGIPEKKVSIIFVNNRHAKVTDVVRPGDVLALFPPIGGG